MKLLSRMVGVADVVKQQRNKSFFVRNLSPMEKGSMRASILTIFSSTIGAGLLSLPKVLSNFGLLSGLGFLALFGLLTGYTYRILNALIEESGKLSYANVVAHFFGKVGYPKNLESWWCVRTVYDSSHDCQCHVVWVGV